MLTFPTSLEAAPVSPVGILRAQLFTAAPVFRLASPTALLCEDFHRIADCIFLLRHYAAPASLAAFSCKYFIYKV